FFWGGDDTAPDADGRMTERDIVDRSATLAGADRDAVDSLTPPAPNVQPPAVLDFSRPEPVPEIEPTPTVRAEPVQPDPTVQQAVREVERALPKPQSFKFSGGGGGGGADAATLYNRGDRLIAEGDLIGGRSALSRLLFAPDLQLADRDAMAVRNRLNEVNAELFWSPEITEGDPITRPYQNGGLFLSQIGPRFRVPYQLLEIVNDLPANRLQADHVIKVVQGPLHARVIKSQFLMDLYALDPQGRPVYICSFPVGLGEKDKTPEGNWQVTKGSKVVNPSWRDDQNGEFFAPDDPKNPIGDYWIAIHGLDDGNKNKRGFGIHGTIDPDSIGTEASRGCIRLADDDIELVFSMLTDHSEGSTIQIVP
ncbi:MAG: L,D-transpeptidase family protein, partial [Planctomycetota bacterium]